MVDVTLRIRFTGKIGCSNGVFQILVYAADNHTGHCLAHSCGRSVVGVFGGEAAVACNEAYCQRIAAQNVVSCMASSFDIGIITGKLSCIRHEYAGVCNSHIAAPVELEYRTSVRAAVYACAEAVCIVYEDSLYSVIEGAVCINAVHCEVRNCTVGGYICPVKTDLVCDALHL